MSDAKGPSIQTKTTRRVFIVFSYCPLANGQAKYHTMFYCSEKDEFPSFGTLRQHVAKEIGGRHPSTVVITGLTEVTEKDANAFIQPGQVASYEHTSPDCVIL